MVKLDEKDKRLIYLLDCDARQPFTKLAKELRLSPEAIQYRIKRLENEGIIKGYRIILDLAKLGLLQCKLCLRFQHMTSDKLRNCLEKLNKITEIKWIAATQGTWDLILSVEASSLKKIDEIKKKILRILEGYLLNKEFSILLESDIYNRRYLVKEHTPLIKRKMFSAEHTTTSQNDNVLKILALNARTPAVEIANKLNTTARIVSYQIKKLIKDKIIVGSTLSLNYNKLGLGFSKLFISLNEFDEPNLTKFITYCQSSKNITNVLHVLSSWDIELEYEYFEQDQLNKFITDTMDQFPRLLREIKVATIIHEHKLEYV